jgi:hypothetical protein
MWHCSLFPTDIDSHFYIVHYLNRVTLGKDYFTLEKLLPSVTLDKYFIGKGFFAEYFFLTLRKDFAECQKTLGKLRIEFFFQKTAKPFFIIIGTTLHQTIYLLNRPIIFHYCFRSNLHILWMVRFRLTTSRSCIPSYTTTLLHQLCLYYVFISHVL